MGTLTIFRVSKALPSSRAKVEVIRTLTSADVDDADVATISGRRHAGGTYEEFARLRVYLSPIELVPCSCIPPMESF